MFSNQLLKPVARSMLKVHHQSGSINLAKMAMSTAYNFETLAVSTPKPFVHHVELNRPDSLNAMNNAMWMELGKCFGKLHSDAESRVVILSGAGKIFTAGLDFKDMMNIAPKLAECEDVARKAKILWQTIKLYQDGISSLENCQKPVIAAIHSGCIGGGINLITAADIRYCTKDAWFQVKEVDIGMAADVGVLQRLPKIVGSESLVRELCYTARKLSAEEALNCGLVSKVFDDKKSMMDGVLQLAEVIASKSPVAVQGTKNSLVYARDHSVQEGLHQIALWNQLMLQSDDFMTATVAQATKQKGVTFSKL